MRNYLTKRNNDSAFNFFDDVFEDFFKPVVYTGRHTMNTDIKETDKGYELAVDMPGFEKQDINLSLSDGYITIEAKREEKETDDKHYVRRERNFSCRRSYYVGEGVTEEDIKAKYVNGTLTVQVPKKETKELPSKNIEIE